MPPAELMKTQTDRKIADELKRTYDVQRESQEKRQELERERAVADMQAEVVRSEQMVRIAEQNAQRDGRGGQGRGGGDAAARRRRGGRDARARRGAGRGLPGGAGGAGPAAYTAMQIATIVGERGIKVVPDIAVGGGRGRAAAGSPRR